MGPSGAIFASPPGAGGSNSGPKDPKARGAVENFPNLPVSVNGG